MIEEESPKPLGGRFYVGLVRCPRVQDSVAPRSCSLATNHLAASSDLDRVCETLMASVLAFHSDPPCSSSSFV